MAAIDSPAATVAYFTVGLAFGILVLFVLAALLFYNFGSISQWLLDVAKWGGWDIDFMVKAGNWTGGIDHNHIVGGIKNESAKILPGGNGLPADDTNSSV